MHTVWFLDPADTLARMRAHATGGGANSAQRSTTKRPAHSDQLTLMPTLTTTPSTDSRLCELGTCRSTTCDRCIATRAQVAVLAIEGYTVEATSVRLGLPVAAVRNHLAATADGVGPRCALEPPRAARKYSDAPDRRKIPNAPLRDLVEGRLRCDSSFTLAELARLAEFPSQTHLERVLGYKRTSDCVKRGTFYAGRVLEEISVAYATRIVRALDVDPREVEGL